MILTGLFLGAVLGYVLQRSRFCVTGAFRDLYMTRSARYFTPFLLAIAIQAIGVAALTGAGVIAPEAASFAPLAVIGGGFSSVAPDFVDQVARVVAREALVGFAGRLRVVPAELAGDAPLVGAAALVHRPQLLG